MNKKSFLNLIFLILVTTAFSQAPVEKPHDCFNELKFESGFIAITTHYNSELAKWYEESFGMNSIKEFTSKDGRSFGIILRRDQFVVEIIHAKELKENQGPSSEVRSGLLKFGVYVNADLFSLKDCLLKEGVKAGRIFRDEELGEELLLVRDPEGNMIEIISRLMPAE
ncbi:VOC family protein [Gramella sp. KN1008]|uniref:VOC family protein n=1 Tax=Gramella sp. KN1008 TaxID=2529298 RepID=UPI00103986B1|nr:VOC family protein [Gramella sp. KN1008]TBW27387.1 hypothetical protein EZJ28_10455 [Gramella sp. KN1008]